MPTWLSLVLPSILAFGGAYLGQHLARRSAKELDKWRKREETMRMLRWASQLAVDEREEHADLGIRMLRALDEAELVQPVDRPLIRAASATMVHAITSRYPGSSGSHTGEGAPSPWQDEGST